MCLRLVLLTVTLALSGLVAGVRAEAAPAPPPVIDGSQVRLAAFMAPVRHTDGRVRAMAVTPVLRLAAGGSAAAVCDLSPRVLDAFISALYRAPLPGYGKAELNVDAVRGRLTEAVNVALGRVLVIGVDLVAGQPKSADADPRVAGATACKVTKKKAN
ncbi:MAG: hypothetical protein IH626_00705 [Rhodospirillales bacterium]|nr:hypothetical protein [Rhodospirillales bacterium]